MDSYSDNPKLNVNSKQGYIAAPVMPENIPLIVINDNTLDNTFGKEKSTIGTSNNEYIGEVPGIMSRAGDGGSVSDNNEKPQLSQLYPNYPGRIYPGIPISETGSFLPDGETIPDVNVYQHKKTFAKGMMDLALFSANVNQLRYVLQASTSHPYYYPSMVFISISLILQVAVGIGLTWNAIYNVKNEKEICIANKINNFTVIGIFIVTVVNVFISAFCVANPPANNN